MAAKRISNKMLPFPIENSDVSSSKKESFHQSIKFTNIAATGAFDPAYVDMFNANSIGIVQKISEPSETA